jgi:hypothetical protein
MAAITDCSQHFPGELRGELSMLLSVVKHRSLTNWLNMPKVKISSASFIYKLWEWWKGRGLALEESWAEGNDTCFIIPAV